MNRREFLRTMVAAGALLAVPSHPARQGQAESDDVIRPPGSLNEGDFLGACVRCSKCIRACPAHCLKSMPLQSGLCTWGTPHIVPRQAGCIRCLNCARVCPTGAIRRVDVEAVKIGTALIHRDQCLVWTHRKECLVCLEYCPVGAISKDVDDRPIVDPRICVGCGVCEQNCPVETRSAAIRVSATGQKRYSARTRRYE